MDIVNPCGVFESSSAPLTERQPLRPETVVGLFANDKKNADVLLGHVQTLLAERCSVQTFHWFAKEASQPAAFTDEFLDTCDVVVAAVCD